MRASELRGLQWGDVDLEGKSISVRRMADHLKCLRPPKSEAGTRTIPIGEFLANTLAAWRQDCLPSHLDVVFPGDAGAIASYSVIYRSGLRPVLINCGLVSSDKSETLAKFNKDGWQALSSGEKRAIKPKYGLHAFRHFYASWRLEQRYNVKQVQTWLGHENATMTLDLYGHLLSDEVDQERMTKEEIDLAGPIE